jgi:hypothetical protein
MGFAEAYNMVSDHQAKKDTTKVKPVERKRQEGERVERRFE